MSYFIRSRKAHKMALFETLLFSSGFIKLYRFCRKWGMKWGREKKSKKGDWKMEQTYRIGIDHGYGKYFLSVVMEAVTMALAIIICNAFISARLPSLPLGADAALYFFCMKR